MGVLKKGKREKRRSYKRAQEGMIGSRMAVGCYKEGEKEVFARERRR